MKTAIYCRLSEEDKNKQIDSSDSLSIQNQKAMLIQYASERSWEIYDIYSDDDYAGADRNRPGFKRLLKDAESRCFDIILCKTQSRFTRELELVEKYIHGFFPAWGIRFVSIVDNADTANKGNKKSRQINGLVNEWYLEDMSENIKSVLNNRRENGFHIGAFALYGYKKDPAQKGHLIVDEEAAMVVREVFSLFSEGYGKTAIARQLNERGIPNPTEYKRRKGLRYSQPQMKNSTLWRYSTVSDMLKNQIYAGDMVQGKYGSVSYKTKQNRPRPESEWYIVKGTHTPIIEKPLWNQVQAQLARRTKPLCTGTVGVFAGKARCHGCGYVMCSSKSHGRYYLQCPNHHVAKGACIGSFISVESLREAVLKELNRLTENFLDKEEFIKHVKPHDDLAEQRACLSSLISAHEKKLTEYAIGLREVYLDKAKGILSEEDYKNLILDFTEQRKRTEQILTDEKQKLSRLEEQNRIHDICPDGAAKYININCFDRKMAEILIAYISVGKRISGTNTVPVEVHWNL